MRRFGFLLVVAACLAAVPSLAFGASRQNRVPPGFTREQIVDYVRGGGSSNATDAATDFKVQLHPFVLKLDHSLAYTIDTSGCSGECANAAAVLAGTSGSTGSGLSAWGVSGLTLTHNESTPNTNPCTSNPDSVTWTSIGSASVLAETFPCIDNTTGKIVGFDIVYNSNATWSDCTSTVSCAAAPSGRVAIAATAAHEGGHVYGLQHDHAAKDVRLTMYFAIGANDYGLATLGCGDRLGVNALYTTSLTCTTLPGD